MSPFGPFYPPRLQASVNHAERLARILLREESHPRRARKAASWLVGRADELERFVEAVVSDWRAGRRRPDTTAVALDAHLSALHDGLARRFGITAPSCCRSDAITRVPAQAQPGGGSDLIESIDQLLMNLEAPETRGRSTGRPGSVR